MDRIIQGYAPTSIFKEMLVGEPSLTNADIARAFFSRFEDVSTEAVQAIWHWKRPGRIHGLSDQELDKILLQYLRGAGYEFPLTQIFTSTPSAEEPGSPSED
jgi:hypothetical protein